MGNKNLKKFPCPSCSSLTLDEKDVYEICPICGWEDDPTQSQDPNYTGGANEMSLNQYREKSPVSHNPVPDELFKNLISLATRIADGFGVKLNYSHDSIKDVERILGRLHYEYKEAKNDKGLNGIALEFAAYIVEVIRRNHEDKGVWYTDHSHFGEKSFPFVWQGNTMFPYNWCQKRIFVGKADDVYFKYQSIVLPKLKRGGDEKLSKKRLWNIFRRGK